MTYILTTYPIAVGMHGKISIGTPTEAFPTSVLYIELSYNLH